MLLKKIRLRKKHIPSFYFKKVAKRRKDIEELIEVPVILEMKDGGYYAGLIDDYESGLVILFTCKQFVPEEIDLYYSENNWIDYNTMADFPLKEIKNIYCAKDDSLNLEQILEISINPYNKILKGIECKWVETRRHSENCNEDLHESLAKLYKDGNTHQSTERKREAFKKAFYVVRRFILENNGKIP